MCSGLTPGNSLDEDSNPFTAPIVWWWQQPFQLQHEQQEQRSSMTGSLGDLSFPTALCLFFLLIFSQEAATRSTDTAFTLQNHIHSLPANPHYRYSNIICDATVSHQFSKLPLKRVCAKNLASSSGETQDTSTTPRYGP